MLSTEVLALFENLARKDTFYNEGNRGLCSCSIKVSPKQDDDINTLHPIWSFFANAEAFVKRLMNSALPIAVLTKQEGHRRQLRSITASSSDDLEHSFCVVPPKGDCIGRWAE